jgi:hypothetical protein
MNKIELIKMALSQAEMRQGCTDQTPYAEILLKELLALDHPQDKPNLEEGFRELAALVGKYFKDYPSDYSQPVQPDVREKAIFTICSQINSEGDTQLCKPEYCGTCTFILRGVKEAVSFLPLQSEREKEKFLTYEIALKLIAGCVSHAPGDIVDIARKALE